MRKKSHWDRKTSTVRRRPKKEEWNPDWLQPPYVVGEAGLGTLSYPKSSVRRFADRNRMRPTASEARLANLLNSLNHGVLRGRFETQYAISGKWIVDIFFKDIRLAIEIDGEYHNNPLQRARDEAKAADCDRFDITLLRLQNLEVWGDTRPVVEKLRRYWRKALARDNKIIGTRVPRI